MKKQILLTGFLFVSAILFGQAELTSWKLNTTGYVSSYYTTSGGSTLYYYTDEADIQEICYDNDYVWISCTGLTTEMGPWQNPGNPSNQDYLFQIPRNPTVPTTKVEAPTVNSIGVLINGIPIFGLSDANSYSSTSNSNEPGNQGDQIWWGEAYYTEGWTLDPMGCHPQQTGAFHSHALATPLWEDTPTSQHSPIIGWAWDGNPIYGPYGYSSAMDANSGTTRMTSSYQLRTMSDRTTLADGSTSVPPGPSDFSTFPLGNYIQDYEYVSGLGTLDEYNGRNCVTPEFPGGTYAYFTTIDNSGDPVFPYYIGIEYYGDPIMDNNTSTVTPSSSCTQYNGALNLKETTSFELEMYPNPTEGVVYISTTETIQSVKMFNSVGQLVDCDYGHGVIRMNDLPNGTYQLQITDINGKRINKRIIKL